MPTLSPQVMADARAEANRMTALHEAAINATLNHPYIVTTYTYDMQPLGDVQTSGRGFLDWQMYIIQVGQAVVRQCLTARMPYIFVVLIGWGGLRD